MIGFALLAACEQSGVQFIVEIPADFGADGDPQVQLPDEVRLFIGVGDEHATLGANVDRAPIGIDSPAVFSYARADGVDELGVVIAVGYTNGVPTSSVAEFHARVGAGSVFQYRMGLNGAANPRDRLMRSRVNQLEIWGAKECVFVENRRQDLEDQGHKVAFIVGAEDDRDCDGLADDDPLECFPEVHLGEGPSTTPTCLYQDANATACTIGVPRCRDTAGDDTSCNATRFCAPPQVCSFCKSEQDEWPCAQNYTRASGSVGAYGLRCVLPAIPSAGGLQLCKPTVDLEVDIVPPFGAMCENVSVKSTADPEFSSTFSLVGAGNTGTVKVSHDACTMKIEPSGMVASSAISANAYSALMAVGLDERRGIAVPVYIEVRALTSCVDNGVCVWVDDGAPDNPDACVAQMQP